MIEFTGERVVPGQVDSDLWNEHFARYAFASRLAAGKRVLDAGCGTGYGSNELALCAKAVTGIDISADAVAYASATYSRPNLTFAQAGCAALPFENGSIDLAVSFEVIEHIAEWKQFLLELRRVLADAGVLIVSTPNKEYYATARVEAGPNPFHVHEFTIDEFQRELAAIFPHVLLCTENHVAAIGIEPSAGADSRLDLARPQTATRTPSQVPHYIVAICSLQPIHAPAPFLYVPPMANILHEREIHIAKLAASVDELKREKEDMVNRFRAQTAELQTSNSWARDLDRKLEAKCEELANCVALLDRAEQTVIERTEWARSLQTLLDSVKASRWVRLARIFGVGPDLGND